MSSSYRYFIHGVPVGSNRALAGLNGLTACQTDISLRIQTLDELNARWPGLGIGPGPAHKPSPRRRACTRHGEAGEDLVVYENSGPNFRLVAVLTSRGDRIEVGWWCADQPGLEAFDRIATPYVLGNLIALALRLAGRIVLHGNASRIGGRPIAWVGHTGAGKSTLSAALAEAGHAPITDDQLVLQECADGYRPAPGVPRIRLWRQSIAAMKGTALPSFRQPFGEDIKGWMVFDAADPEREKVSRQERLSALYLLLPRDRALRQAEIGDLEPGRRVQCLVEHSLARVTLPLNPAEQRAEWAALARLASRLPIHSLRLPDRLDALPAVVAQLAGPGAAPTLGVQR